MNFLKLNSTTAGRTAAAIAERALLGGVTFAVWVLLGWWGGPEELGLFALFFPMLSIAIAFQESLIVVPYTVYVLEHAEGAARRRFLGCVLVHTAALGLAVAAVFGLAGAGLIEFGPRRYASVALMLAIAAPCALMREFARRIVYAERNPAAAIVISGSAGVLQLAAMALLYAGGHLSAASSFLAMGLSGLATGAVWFYVYRREIEFRGAAPVAAFRSNWDMGRWNLATQVSEIVRTQMFPWLLALAATEKSVGMYAACAVVAALPTPLLVAVSYVLLPEFVHERRHGGLAAANRLMWRATGWLTAVMTLFAIVVTALSANLVPWLCDPQTFW